MSALRHLHSGPCADGEPAAPATGRRCDPAAALDPRKAP